MLFSEDMTWIEALNTLWKAIDGKSPEEQEEILKEYKQIIPAITEKELDGKDWLD